MNRKKLVSIIIPAYQAEKFIRDCVESVFLQLTEMKNSGNKDYKLFEVIVVNDCSTDGTQEALIDLKLKYPSLHIISNKKRINTTMCVKKAAKSAKGEYGFIVNACDTLFDSALSTIKDSIEFDHTDVIRFNVDHQLSKYGSVNYESMNDHHYLNEIMSGKEALEHWVSDEEDQLKKYYKKANNISDENYSISFSDYSYSIEYCVKIDLLKGIKLYEDVHYYQDMIVIPQILLKAKTFINISDKCYIYRDTEHKIYSGSSDYLAGCLENLSHAYDKAMINVKLLKDLSEEVSDSPEENSDFSEENLDLLKKCYTLLYKLKRDKLINRQKDKLAEETAKPRTRRHKKIAVNQ